MSLPHDEVNAKTKTSSRDITSLEIDKQNIKDDKGEVFDFQRLKLFGRFVPSEPEARKRGILAPAEDGLSSLYQYQVSWENVTILESRSRLEHFVVEILGRNFTRLSEC